MDPDLAQQFCSSGQLHFLNSGSAVADPYSTHGIYMDPDLAKQFCSSGQPHFLNSGSAVVYPDATH